MLRRFEIGLPLALVLLAIAYGTVLRLEVLVERYGTIDHPSWARMVTQDIAPLAKHLHPSAYRWYRVEQPYVGGDPINYIKYAREMRSFYQAHVREPVFLALTRTYLWLLDDQDVAVSFASITGSILTIVAAYLLGTVVLSRAAGVVLAFIIAMEYELISWSVDGWRDDVFMATVTFAAWAFVRCQRDPSRKSAVFLGITTAAACLTRITALSFAIPAFAWLMIDGGQERMHRARMTIAAALVGAMIVGPYLVNCAIATGDPLYAINYHTVYYRSGEGLPAEKPMSALSYMNAKIQGRPITALDTAITGLFVQPFRVKWTGLDGWISGARTVLSWLSIIGMLRWIFLAEGRMLLVIMVGSLVPYALTWNVAGGGEWRFTMHTYPLYLTASMSGAAFCWQFARNFWRRAQSREFAIPRAQLLRAGSVAVVTAVVTGLYTVLPWFVVRETIAARTDVSVLAGGRDATFFGAGWSGPYADGLTFRVSRAEHAVVRIPLPEQRPYQVVLRLDPVAPERQRRAVVLLNRQLLATLILTWTPDRVGSYPLLLPGPRYADMDRDDQLGVRLWYVRVLASS
jgi:4-amino-4-deoxy-L-arabinose transferase-like glycosyltransferase